MGLGHFNFHNALKSNSDKYSVDYFLEKSTIGKWKLKHRISIASEKWKTADISGLVEERNQMAKLLLQSFKYDERLQNNHLQQNGGSPYSNKVAILDDYWPCDCEELPDYLD